MAFQYIPDDVSKFVYLYHPDFDQAKRVRRYGPNGSTAGPSDEYRTLQTQGWSEQRFAQMLYHDDYEPYIARTYAEVEEMLAEGWSKTIAEGKHPHANDKHRQRYLKMKADRAANPTPQTEVQPTEGLNRRPGRPRRVPQEVA